MKYVVLVLYILMLVAVLITTAKKNLSLNEFLLGGRNIGPWMSAFSYGASYFSAVIIIGYAGSMGWNYGAAATWAGIGNAIIGSLLAWRFLAKPARSMGERLSVTTIPEFFEKRYSSKALKIFAALLIFVFLIPYSASVYKGLGMMFKIALGIDYTWCVIGIALLAGAYLFFGGYKATAITDFVQGIIMLFGIIAIFLFVIFGGAGGISAGLEKLGDAAIGGPEMNTLFYGGQDKWGLISNIILTSFGVWGMPQMVHKFFAIKDTKSVKHATIISTVFALIIAGGAYFMGGFGRVILARITDPATGETLHAMVESGAMAKDAIMPTIFVSDVVGMPPALIGLLIVLLLSASISTLTGLVLASSSVITLDLVGSAAPKMKQQSLTLLMRVLCLVFVALSLVINFTMQDTPIMSLMSLSWGTLAGAFLAPFLYGLVWKGVTKAGAYAGIISGALISVVPPLIMGMSVAPSSGAIAILSGLVIVPVVSLLTPKTKFSDERMREVFGK